MKFKSLKRLTVIVVVWEVLSVSRDFMLPIHLSQQVLKHQSDVLLVVDTMYHNNCSS